MIYAKLGALIAAIALIFWAGWHLGSSNAKTALAGFKAAQAENTAKAVLAERASAAAELARVNTILKGYEDAPINPIDAGLAHRVYVYAHTADCAVPTAGANTPAAGSTSPQPSRDPSFVGLAQRVIDACAQDAAELTALQQAWPR